MRNAINNLESPFLDEEILEKWVGVNSMQVSALGRPTVGVSSASGSYSRDEMQSGYKVVRRASMYYIDSRAGLGESKQEPFTTSAGDQVGAWLCQGMVPGGIIRPDEGGRVIGLRVIFRRSFADFRREVQQAVERWGKDPRVASKLVTANENLLKAHHKQMLAEKVPDKVLVRLFGSFFYRATGCTWNLVKLEFPSGRERWERITANIPPIGLPGILRPWWNPPRQ